MKDRPSPSRPIRQQRIVGHSIWRVPGDGPVIPRLRREASVEAIGFVHNFDQEEDES